MSDEVTTDEYGDVNVFSEERLAKIKARANEEFVTMTEVIKKSETALTGFAEWSKAAEANERRFYVASKAYVETLKAVESENLKCKF